MAASARAHGAEIETGAGVREVLVESDRAVGVVLDNGTLIRAKYVASSVNPKLLYTRLIPGNALPKPFLDRITTWRNLRPSCWLSTIVGEGMILSPEGGGGCSCGNWLETSMAFSPLQVSTAPARRPLPTGGDAIESGQ